MPVTKTAPRSDRWAGPAVISAVVIGAVLFGVWLWGRSNPGAVQPGEIAAVRRPIAARTIIDYNQLSQETDADSPMQQRKAAYGLNKGVDIIAGIDESIRVGDTTVSVAEIMEQIRLQEGRIMETDSDSTPAGAAADALFGIYVVKAGDNIWNIHYNLLKEYFRHKGVPISPMADEPDQEVSERPGE